MHWLTVWEGRQPAIGVQYLKVTDLQEKMYWHYPKQGSPSQVSFIYLEVLNTLFLWACMQHIQKTKAFYDGQGWGSKLQVYEKIT